MANLPEGTPPPDRIHYHNYAIVEGHQEFFGSQGIIDGMKQFSQRMNQIPELQDKPILISEWGGLSRSTDNLCGANGAESNLELMRTTGAWIASEGRQNYGYVGAAWFISWCPTGSQFCSEGSVLYQNNQGPDLTCIGEVFFNEIIPSW